MRFSEITMNNAIGLLRECLINGEEDANHLWAWFNSEKHLLKETIEELDPRCEECGGTAEMYIKVRIGDKHLRFCHRDCLRDYVKRVKGGNN